MSRQKSKYRVLKTRQKHNKWTKNVFRKKDKNAIKLKKRLESKTKCNTEKKKKSRKTRAPKFNSYLPILFLCNYPSDPWWYLTYSPQWRVLSASLCLSVFYQPFVVGIFIIYPVKCTSSSFLNFSCSKKCTKKYAEDDGLQRTKEKQLKQ